MSAARYIDEQTAKVKKQTEAIRARRKQIQRETEQIRQQHLGEALAEGLAEGRAWNERRLEAKARGEPFDEPFPGDEEAEGHREGTGEHKMPDESAQYPAPKVWSHNNGQAEFILRSMSESLVRVTHRDQVGYIGVNQNWDVGKPYTWTYMDRTTGPSRADMERDARPDGIHGNPFGESTPEEALTLLCNILLETQGEEDSRRINPEERKRSARKVLGEFLDRLPDWEGG